MDAVTQRGPGAGRWIGWGLFALLLAALWVPSLDLLWKAWRREPGLSHGPILAVITLALLWQRRKALREGDPSVLPSALLLAISVPIFLAGCLILGLFRHLGLLGITAGAIGLLGGKRALGTAAGALGLMAFALPWPATVIERIAFPLQLASSTYAALLGGMLGIPVRREGVYLSVVPEGSAKPIYSMLVAQACSGLTSLIVLLALGYLVAYFTPVRRRWRALMVAAMPLLALLANSIRLTLILIAGTLFNASLAQWVHDHEAPVLIGFARSGCWPCARRC